MVVAHIKVVITTFALLFFSLGTKAQQFKCDGIPIVDQPNGTIVFPPSEESGFVPGYSPTIVADNEYSECGLITDAFLCEGVTSIACCMIHTHEFSFFFFAVLTFFSNTECIL